jgi:hypothetical protein
MGVFVEKKRVCGGWMDPTRNIGAGGNGVD